MLVGLSYSLAPLPEQPMAPRRADPRVGFFTDSYNDLSDDLRANPRVQEAYLGSVLAEAQAAGAAV